MKLLTFTMEDALISQEGLAILAGAGLFEANGTDKFIYVHKSGAFEVTATNTIDLVDEYGKSEKIAWNKSESETTNYDYHKGADIFCMIQDEDGNITSEPCVPASVRYASGKTTIKCHADGGDGKTKDLAKGTIVFIDYYVKQSAGQQIEITPDEFAGSFYIEADTLFRRESDNKDVPAEFIIPNGKVQSNFNFSMSNSGDPSTFAFTVDALPGYTKFNKKKKVLACIQIIESDKDEEAKREACVVAGE